MNAASLATMLSGIPFEEPVGSVRLPGLIDGRWVSINPTFQDLEEATFDIVVAGRRSDAGQVDILMIEGEAPDNTWTLLEGADAAPARRSRSSPRVTQAAKRAIDELIEAQLELVAQADVKPKPFQAQALYGEDTWTAAELFKERPGDRDRACNRAASARRHGRESRAPEGHLLETWGKRDVRRSASPRSHPRGKTCRRRSCALA